MFIQIRQGVFETNSSSTHSITMCSESDFKKWGRGEVYLNEGYWSNTDNPAKDKTFITKEEALELALTDKYWHGEDLRELNDDEFDDVMNTYFDVFTCYDYSEKSYLEYYEEHYTTENGDEVVAFGQYGYDG